MCLNLIVVMKSVQIVNFRSIADSEELELGPINIIIGRNNSGKTALLRAIGLAQGYYSSGDVRLRQIEGWVRFKFGYNAPKHFTSQIPPDLDKDAVSLHCKFTEGVLDPAVEWVMDNSQQARRSIGAFPNTRPHHYIVPIFARRRAERYEELVRAEDAQNVFASDRNLTSRITALATGTYQAAVQYRYKLKQLFGFPIETYLVPNGLRPGKALSPLEGLSLDTMGEGIGSAIRLITELVDSTGKLFLIEEPENDLHPEALQKLLTFIIDAVPSNQFILTTHSDLVLRQLGAQPKTRVYETSTADDKDSIPTTTVKAIESVEDRLRVLADLGYPPEFPSGWLIFEESTAERVCKEVLIPHFAPGLARLRTLSASGASKVFATFDDLFRVFLFVHFTEKFRRRGWVLVDNDEPGQAAVTKLRRKFSDWPVEHFDMFDQPAFEAYYPERFAADCDSINDVKLSKQERQERKGALANKVCEWAEANPEEAVSEFRVSAAGAIEALRRIEARVGSKVGSG